MALFLLGYAFTLPPPDLSGDPGERIATVTKADVIRRGTKWQVLLELETTDGGFEEVERTGNVVVDEVFDGAGGVWGYTIGATDFDFPVPDVAPYGQLRLTHYMQAYGYTNFHNGEVGAGFSVKLGDPLQPVSGRSLRLPEPGAALLLGASLPGLAWLLARRRRA